MVMSCNGKDMVLKNFSLACLPMKITFVPCQTKTFISHVTLFNFR